MEREKIKLDNVQLREIVFENYYVTADTMTEESFVEILKEITGTSRHGNYNEMVVQRKSDGKFFRVGYEDSVKDSCDFNDMNDGGELVETFPKQKQLPFMCNVINRQLEADVQFMEGLSILHKKKPLKKIIGKACEELSELTTKLLQHANKTPDDRMNEEILEEIVDVQQHLILLQKFFSFAMTIAVTNEKTTKFLNSKNFLHYQTKQVESKLSLS